MAKRGKNKNLLEGVVISQETRNKIERRARREAEMEVGSGVYKSKVHKNMKAIQERLSTKIKIGRMTKDDLIEDYDRRLENINSMIEALKDEEQTDKVKATIKRYKTKRGCYNTFLSELKKLEDE